MTEIPDSIRCVFTATVEENMGEHVVEIPASQIDHGTISPDETYRIVITDVPTQTSRSEPAPATDGHYPNARPRHPSERGPPVDEGDVLEVSIETIGDQGDGIAKVDRGFVIIVPESEPGDDLTVRIESVHENMAFAEIVKQDHEVPL